MAESILWYEYMTYIKSMHDRQMKKIDLCIFLITNVQ